MGGNDSEKAILFTAFEPSGDAHAAPVIAELLRRAPGLRVCAWGGPRMEEAGATRTTLIAVVTILGFGSLSLSLESRKLLWLLLAIVAAATSLHRGGRDPGWPAVVVTRPTGDRELVADAAGPGAIAADEVLVRPGRQS